VRKQISTSQQFFLWDYDSTLFPLQTNRLIVEKYAPKILEFVQDNVLAHDGSFNTQHRVFASKRGWFLRPTVKLDPVAEFYFYDLIYRNRGSFRKPRTAKRSTFGFRISEGNPIPILDSYSEFKKCIAKYRSKFACYIYFDIASYFNHIYHHDLVRWFEDSGASDEDVVVFGKFMREIVGGNSVNFLPQGLYPSKMVGSSFLKFLEDSAGIRSSQMIRLMDDVWIFDDEEKTLTSDFLLIQNLLSKRGLTLNEGKSIVLQGHDPSRELPASLDDMKIQLLQKRREQLSNDGGYYDPADEYDNDDDESEDLEILTEDEQTYLISLLEPTNIQEEDAELVLTLMRDHSADVVEFLPTLVRNFPGLAKRIYYFCFDATDKTEIASALLEYVESDAEITEYQLFWFGKMLEDFLLKTSSAGDLLFALYEHENATDITKAKILETPEKRFGLNDLQEEQLKTGHSDWLSWSAAVGARVHPKGQRNQILKYFRKASPMNQFVGEFVETCF
jgi:Reverse transcriptase (RNA-dependent DNA polymerase)